MHCSLSCLDDLISNCCLPSCEVSLCTIQTPHSHSYNFPQMNDHLRSRPLLQFYPPSRPSLSLILAQMELSWLLQPSQVFILLKLITSMAFIQILSLMDYYLSPLWLLGDVTCALILGIFYMLKTSNFFICSSDVSSEHQNLMIYKLLSFRNVKKLVNILKFNRYFLL